jgi:AIR synthase related protein, N-terminal domain
VQAAVRCARGTTRPVMSRPSCATTAPAADNPYDWGRIAAANALSDIYAMGGTPTFAVNLLCWPPVRDARGPYGSAEELSVFADLPPAVTDRLAGDLLFLRE